MKRILLLLSTFLLLPLIAFAQNSSLLKEAQDLFAAGNYSAAVAKYQEAVSKLSGRDRNIAQLQLGMAKTCVDALNKAKVSESVKDYDTAISEYQKVLDANPNDTKVKGLQELARKSKQNANLTLTVSNSNLSFPSSGGSKKITVNCSTYWSLVDQTSSMCTVTRDGNEITISCTSNPNTGSRNTSFIVRAAYGAKEQIVSISQTGRVASSSTSSSSGYSTATRLTVNPTSISLSSGSGSTTINVSTDAKDYDVSLLPTWASVKNKYSSFFVLSYSENNTSNTRSDWFNVNAGGKTVKVSIKQSGRNARSYSSSSPSSSSNVRRLTVKPTSITLPSSGGSTMVDISTDSKDYEVTLLPSWIKLKNKYESFFSLTYSENHSYSSRSDWFNVKAGGKTVRVDVTQKGRNLSASSGGGYNSYGSGSSSLFTIGVDVSFDYFDSYNFYYYSYDYSYPLSYGIGLRARFGRYDQWLNLIGGLRYVTGNGKTGLMAPVLLNLNLIKIDILSLYFGGGFEFSCLDSNSYRGEWVLQGGLLCGPHTDLQLFYKPNLSVFGGGFTYYF